MTAEGSEQLTLAEQLLLLAIKRSGGVHRSAQMALDFGLVSALLLELALRGKVELVRDSLVCQEGAEPTGDPLLDEAFERVSDPEAQPRLLRTLVSTLRPGSGRWRGRVGLRLVERGLLTVKRGRLLGRLRRPRIQLAGAALREEIAGRVSAALLGAGKADEPTTLLASLVDTCGMTKLVVPARRREEARIRAQSMISTDGRGADLVRSLGDPALAIMGIAQELRGAVDLSLSHAVDAGQAAGADGAGGHGGDAGVDVGF